MATLELEIPEVAGDEAPEAIFATQEHHWGEWPNDQRERVTTTFRGYNGQLYSDRPPFDYPYREPRPTYQTMGLQVPESAEVERALSNTFPNHVARYETAVSRIQQLFRDVLLVDGEVWIRTTEPYYQLSSGSSFRDDGVAIRITQAEYPEDRRARLDCYPLNWKRVILEKAERMAERRGCPPPTLPAEIRVLRSDVVQHVRYHKYRFQLGSPNCSVIMDVVGCDPEDAITYLRDIASKEPARGVNTRDRTLSLEFHLQGTALHPGLIIAIDPEEDP